MKTCCVLYIKLLQTLNTICINNVYDKIINAYMQYVSDIHTPAPSLVFVLVRLVALADLPGTGCLPFSLIYLPGFPLLPPVPLSDKALLMAPLLLIVPSYRISDDGGGGGGVKNKGGT